MHTPAAFTLRPITPADQQFLLAVYASTREDELRQAPWTPEQRHQFLVQQFDAQDTAYRQLCPDASFDVIEVGRSAAGRLLVDRRPDEVHVLDIALLPEFRRRGIGTAVLQELCAEAAATRRRVSLYVEKFNPARQLYARLGFREVADTAVYSLLEWTSPID